QGGDLLQELIHGDQVRLPVEVEIGRHERGRIVADRVADLVREGPIATTQEYRDVLYKGRDVVARDKVIVVDHGQVEETVPVEVLGHDRLGRTADRKPEWGRKRPASLLQADADVVGQRMNQGQVEEPVAVEIGDRQGRRAHTRRHSHLGPEGAVPLA